MKMHQKRHKKAALFVSALLLSGTVFSAPVNKEALASECNLLGISLSQLAQTNSKEYCTKDVDKSAHIMTQSAFFIQNNQIDFARDNLIFVNKTFRRIALNEKGCPYFSSMIAPYKEKTSHLIRELDSLIHRLN